MPTPNHPSPLATLFPKVNIPPIPPINIRFQSPAQREAALLRQQADIAKQVRDENPAVDTAMKVGKLALGVAAASGLAAGIAALTAPTVAPHVTREDAAKIGASSYAAAISLVLVGGAVVKMGEK